MEIDHRWIYLPDYRTSQVSPLGSHENHMQPLHRTQYLHRKN